MPRTVVRSFELPHKRCRLAQELHVLAQNSPSHQQKSNMKPEIYYSSSMGWEQNAELVMSLRSLRMLDQLPAKSDVVFVHKLNLEISEAYYEGL